MYKQNKQNAYSKMIGKTIERIIDGGEDSQIFVFSDGTHINIFNDSFNDTGIGHQQLTSDFENIEIF